MAPSVEKDMEQDGPGGHRGGCRFLLVILIVFKVSDVLARKLLAGCFNSTLEKSQNKYEKEVND